MSPSWLVIPGYLYFGVVSLFWVAALLKTAKGKSDLRFRVSVADPGPEGAPHVAVIIPARNEEANIGPCLDSVLGQDYRYTRAFVLDDGSTDHTTEILTGYADKATILKGGGGALPPGWLGKPWACQRAAEAALASTPTPDWLLFIDADGRLHPHAISASLGYVSSHNLIMLVGFGGLIMVNFWGKLMQPMIAGCYAGAAAIAPLAILAVVYLRLARSEASPPFALLAGLLAAALLLAAHYFRRG